MTLMALLLACLASVVAAQEESATSSASVSADGSVAEKPLIRELHKNNFDGALLEHEQVLVHFYAPWSKRCEIVRPHLEALARSEAWGSRMVHTRSDISDPEGYTSYIEMYGVTKLPTIILFRHGHANIFPLDADLAYEALEEWLQKIVAEPLKPRDSSAMSHEARMVEATEMLMRQHDRKRQEREDAEKARREELGTEVDDKLDYTIEDPVAMRDAVVPTKKNVKDNAMLQAQRKGSDPRPAAAAEAADEEPAPVAASDAGAVEGRRLDADANAKADADADADTDTTCEALKPSTAIGDASFEKVVMDKSKDVFVLFYRTSLAGFCAGPATVYASFGTMVADSLPSVLVVRMDVDQNKSPFVFEDSELPVIMLFPAKDKRPLEFDKELDVANLLEFARENGSTLGAEDGAASESE